MLTFREKQSLVILVPIFIVTFALIANMFNFADDYWGTLLTGMVIGLFEIMWRKLRQTEFSHGVVFAIWCVLASMGLIALIALSGTFQGFADDMKGGYLGGITLLAGRMIYAYLSETPPTPHDHEFVGE